MSVPDLSEKDWTAQVVSLATMFGWKRYHTHFSKRSPRGFPDEVLVRPPRIVFAELKSDVGKLTEAQAEWLEALAACGLETHVWRPSDLEQVGQVLGRREAKAAA